MSFTKKQLLPGEVLVVLAHQHPVILLRPILLNVLSAAVLAGLSIYLRRWWFLLFCLIPLAYLAWEIIVRRGREYIVTDRRVVRQEGVFSISSFDAPLDKINNVFHEQSLLGRILGYGTVGLETASEQGTTVFDHIPKPLDFKNCIVHQRESVRAGSGMPIGSQGEGVPRMLEELASLRDRNIITPEEFEAKKKSLLDKI
jgi:Bacterial PH domain/Short C-terminal domain